MHPEDDFQIEKIYYIEGFVYSHKVDEPSYRKIFIQNYSKISLLKKIYPITLKDKILILYFDERIADKKTKVFLKINPILLLYITNHIYMNKK